MIPKEPNTQSLIPNPSQATPARYLTPNIRPDIWVEVNLAALRHNLHQVRGLLRPETRLCAVVKGNGFGHGYVEPAKAFIAAGADFLAVTRLDEALTLRNGGITAPILILAPILPQNAPVAIEQDLTCAVDSLPLAHALADAARYQEKKALVHVKVDTGMGRLGLLPDTVPDFFRALTGIHGITATGLFTHFATAADADLAGSRRQLIVFKELLAHLQAEKIPVGLAHAANSAALLRLPDAHLDMVRAGTVLYGQYPSAHAPRTLDLQPTWQLKARIVAVRELPVGAAVGYGAEFVTRRPTRTAIVLVGFADGFTLAPEGPIWRQSPLKLLVRKYKRALTMTVRGQSVPVIGRVSMQLTVLDVTDAPGVEVGDEVQVPTLRLATNSHIPRLYQTETVA